MLAQLFATAVLAVAAATASPSPAPSPAPSPFTSGTPLPVIGTVTTQGRRVNLIGTSTAASEGYIGQEQIATRPILRPGEILEAIPGLVISQHSGEGKANQYYLRGFQLDHGTDLESTIAGVPVNLPTHAHGQGYSDINWLIPELVSYVEYKKGPYYADEGDFSTAGSYDLFYRNTIAPTFEAGIGQYGYNRLFAANSPKLGSGNLLYAIELYHDNGSLQRPDEYQKLNGVLRYSHVTPATSFALTGTAYSGTFNSSDQIPQRLIDAGTIGRFGFIDPSDGGNTSRYALSAQYQNFAPRSTTYADAYGFSQLLDLYSNFTYYLDDATDYYNVTSNPVTCNTSYATCAPGPQHVAAYDSYCPANGNAVTAPARSLTPAAFQYACGDQREQEDKRFVTGFNIRHAMGVGGKAVTEIGLGVRNDNISAVGLFLTNDRMRYANGTLGSDHVLEQSANVWAQTALALGPKVRAEFGLRGDLYDFSVGANVAANSGKVSQGIVSPKFSLAYKASAQNEFYLDFGQSFHSNDGRGTTLTLDPQTNAPYDAAGAPVQQVSPLVRATGEEAGYRFYGPRWNATVSLWQLNLASQLVFEGDSGTTSVGRPTVRKGIELANFFTLGRGLTINADFATSTARFLTDPESIGTGVPESLNTVVSIGATIDRPTFAASLQTRYFGPRVLIEDGSAVSAPSTLLNGQFTWKAAKGYQIRLDVLNVLNANVNDIAYYYGSWLPTDASGANLASPAVNPLRGGSGVNDFHVHPSEQRTLRLSFSRRI